MTSGTEQCKLAAIMFTDMAGHGVPTATGAATADGVETSPSLYVVCVNTRGMQVP